MNCPPGFHPNVRANAIENFVLTRIDAFVNVTAQRLKIIEDINYEQTVKAVADDPFKLRSPSFRNLYLTYSPDILVNMTQSNNNNINDPSIKKLFEGKNFVSISTLMRDGTPQITPTWVDIEEQDGGHILVNTAMGRIKQRNVSRNPNVALAVFDQNNPFDMVSVRGKVVEQVTGDTAEKHIDKLAKKYLGKDKYPGRSPGEKRVILKIKPEHVFHMNYTAPS